MNQDRPQGKRIEPGTAARLHEQREGERSAPGSAYRIQGGTAARKAESAPRDAGSRSPYEVRISGRVGRPFTFSNASSQPGERLPADVTSNSGSTCNAISESGTVTEGYLSPVVSISRGPLNLPVTSPTTSLSMAQPPTYKTLDAAPATQSFLRGSLSNLQSFFRGKG